MADMFDPSMTMNSLNGDLETQQNEFVQGCAGFAAGATAAVFLRLFARWHKSTTISYDDYAIALSLIPLWALAGTGIGIAQHGGLGQEASTLTPQQSTIFYPAAFASYILYGLAITAAKISILLLYRRIFTTSSFRRYIDFFQVLCYIWCILVVFLAVFRCNPISAAWSAPWLNASKPNTSSATCIPIKSLYYGTATSNLFLDVMVNLLPARQIWHLQLPLRQRVLLIICMCTGIVSIGAGIGRVLTIPNLTSSDLPASIAMPYLFVIVEPSAAIICACLPTYRPLAIWLCQSLTKSAAGSKIKSLLQSSSASSSNSTNNTGSRPSRWSRRSSGWFGQKPRDIIGFRTSSEAISSPNMGEKRNLLSVSVDSTPLSSPEFGHGNVYESTAAGRPQDLWSDRT